MTDSHAPTAVCVHKSGDEIENREELPVDESLKVPDELERAAPHEVADARAILAREVIRERASGTPMDLGELRSDWLHANLALPIYPAACNLVLPVFESLVKYVSDTVRRQKERADRGRDDAEAKKKAFVKESE